MSKPKAATGISIGPALAELERAYDEIAAWVTQNYGYVGSRLDRRPIITIQTKGKRKNDGWYKDHSWQSDTSAAVAVIAGNRPSDQQVGEICIAAESLNKTADEILLNLTHQMVHHANQGQDQNQNDYHKYQFMSTGSYMGLHVGQLDSSHGYADILPKAQLTKCFQTIALDPSAFDYFRTTAPAETVKNKQMLWTCGCTKIRSASFIHNACDFCGNWFVYADKDKDTQWRKDWLENESKYGRKRGYRRERAGILQFKVEPGTPKV
jgi:hypothetical protein